MLLNDNLTKKRGSRKLLWFKRASFFKLILASVTGKRATERKAIFERLAFLPWQHALQDDLFCVQRC